MFVYTSVWIFRSLVGCWFVHVFPAELQEMLLCVLLRHYNGS